MLSKAYARMKHPMTGCQAEGYRFQYFTMVPTHYRGINGETRLHTAADEGFEDVLQTLYRKGADINAQDNKGQTPLFIAAKKGHLDVVVSLLRAGADIEKRDRDGLTPLLIACKQGHAKVVKELLTHKANADAECPAGETALFYAQRYGHVKVIKVLRENRASLQPGVGFFEKPMSTVMKNKQNMLTELKQLRPVIDKQEDSYFHSISQSILLFISTHPIAISTVIGLLCGISMVASCGVSLVGFAIGAGVIAASASYKACLQVPEPFIL